MTALEQLEFEINIYRAKVGLLGITYNMDFEIIDAVRKEVRLTKIYGGNSE